MSHHTLPYRRDIDGLRAIAVGSVIAYHAFPNLVPGGFVGVDIFFVISGFLITGILVREHERSGRIDLAEFYARRFRRLLPALLTVLVTTLALGIILLPATGELQSLAKSTLAALFFSSNIFFVLQPSGYFAAAPEIFPLLHTWTLAVEEQFYIVWPLLISLTASLAVRIGKSRRFALSLLFGMVFVTALTLCVVVTGWRPTFAFYLTPFRSWEFAIGAMLSNILKDDHLRAVRSASLLSLGGLGLIAFSLWGFDHRSEFPGWIALVPTTGAILLLAAGAIPGSNPIMWLLSTRPAVYIGQLSYGWYLWHWPLLALVRSAALGHANTAAVLAAVAASFLLSVISFTFIETPVRTQSWRIFKGTRLSIVSATILLASGALAAVGTWLLANHQLASSPWLQSISEAKRASEVDPRVPVSCTNYETSFQKLTPFETCLLGNAKARTIVMIIGDSHAWHLVPMLDKWGKQRNIAILPRVRNNCPPFQDDVKSPAEPQAGATLVDCKKFHDAAFDEARRVAATGRLAGIIIGSRWPAEGAPFATASTFADPASPSVTGLARLVALGRKQKFRIVMTRDTPYFPFDVPQCLSRRSVAACSVSRAQADKIHMPANTAIEQLAARNSIVRVFDPSREICDDRFCYPERDGVVLFRDKDHLSIAGSRMLEPRLRDAIDRAVLAP